MDRGKGYPPLALDIPLPARAHARSRIGIAQARLRVVFEEFCCWYLFCEQLIQWNCTGKKSGDL